MNTGKFIRKSTTYCCLAVAVLFQSMTGASAQDAIQEANAGPDQIVSSGEPVSLDGSGSMFPDSEIISWRWKRTGGTGNPELVIYDTDSDSPYFTAETLQAGKESVTHEFTLTVTGANNETATDDVAITVESAFLLPVALPGENLKVASGTRVSLDGSGSRVDHSRTITNWEWTFVDDQPDSPLVFTGENTSILSFIAENPEPGAKDLRLLFVLTIRDDAGNISLPVQVAVTVTSPPVVPVANAGPDQIVSSGEPVSLDGSSSMFDGGEIILWHWQRTGGTGDPNIVISDTDTDSPYFTTEILQAGKESVTHKFTLTVTGANNETATDDVVITVESAFLLPVARPGEDLTVTSGTRVSLDGSGSRVDHSRTITNWEWTRIGGSPDSSPRLEGMDTSTLSFIAENPEPGADDIRHLFTLVITDDAGNVSSPEEVTVIVTSPVILPVANAGPDQTVPSNEFVYLDGSGSTFDGGDITSWQWEFTGGTGKSDIVIHNADTDSPYFITDRLPKGKAPITYEITLTVTGANNEIATDEIVITVESLFLLPVADPGDNLKVNSGTMVHLDGGDSRVDHSRTIVKWNWTYVGGSPDFSPVLVGTDTSTLSFLAENPEPAARDVRHLFTLTITDDAGNVSLPGPITVIVESPVIAPVAIAGGDKTVSTKWPVFLDGRRTTGDPRAKLFYRWKRTGGTPRFPTGDLNLAGVNEDVAYFYFNPLKPGSESETHEITLTVTDNLGSPASVDVITVTVISAFAKPVADAGDDLVVATGTQVMLDGGDSTVDRRNTLEYSWTRTGGTQGADAVLTGAQTANPVFTAGTVIPGMEEIEHVFTLTVTDNENQIASDTVTVTIVTAFAQPFADAGSDRKVNSGQTVLLDGTGSTVDRYRMPASLLWTRTGGTEGVNVALDDATSSTPSFTALNSTPGARDVIHEFTLTVRDSVGKTASDMVMVAVTSPFARPVANAGEDQSIMAGETILLDGRGSGTDYRKTLTYAWKRTGGTGNPSLSLINENTAEPSFVADSLAPGTASVTHIFSLDVTDGSSIIPISDEVTITVFSANAQPIADAGDDLTVSPDTFVALDGRRSLDIDGHIVSWNWTRVDGSGKTGVILKDTDTSGPSFTAEKPEPGAGDVFHVFSLVVTDNKGAVSQQDTVKVTVTSRILPPIANAGPDLMVRSGTEAMLDGSRSIFDPRNPITSWNWRRIGGSSDFIAELQDADTASPVFTAEDLATGAEHTTHILELKVTDSKGETSFDTITVTVNSPFESLEANAGPDRTVDPQVGVFLDAVASRGDRRAELFYKWTHSAGPKEAIHALRETDSARMSFITGSIIPGTADVIHEFTLTVTDNLGSSPDSDTAMVTVIAPFASLVARAGGNRAVASGAKVILDGSASTVDRRKTLMSYAWTRTGGSGDAGVTLANAATGRASFTAETLAPGANDVTHEFTLMITDNDGLSATDRAVITVTAPFAIPVADAGDDRTVEAGTAVILDDGASTSDRRRSLAYTWQRTGGTGNVQITLDRSDTQKPSFTADLLVPGTDDITHEFTLTVTDSAGLSATDQVIITVTAPFARPIADAGGNRAVASGAKVILDGSASTVDRRRTLAHAWTRTGGSGVSAPVLEGANTARLSFTVAELEPGAKNVTHEFTLTVTDSTGLSATDRMFVTVIARNAVPVADAGGNRTVASGETVRFNGLGSTADRRRTLSYIWTRTGGSSNAKIDLIGANTAEMSFIADSLMPGANDVTHEFVLTVIDSAGLSARDRATVTVTSPFADPFASPVAHAGKDRNVASGEAVVLDGTGSTFDPRRSIAYAWTRTGGTGNGEIFLTETDSVNASFTAQILAPGAEDVTHIFTLTVTDSGGEIDSDTVIITVMSAFIPPVANAGNDRTVSAGEPVTLDGRGSTADRRRNLVYAWERTGGTDTGKIILTGTDSATPSFTAQTLAPGAEDATHEFTLAVTDNAGEIDSDTVIITVVSAFASPVAKAGNDRTVSTGEAVTLDGRGSTPDRRRSLVYAWERTGGTDTGGIVLTGTDSATPSFTAQALTPGAEDATHEFTLTVTDSAGEIDSDTVTITVVSTFALPVAKAGSDQSAVSGTTVKLDGAGSSVDRRAIPAFYLWTRTGGTKDADVVLTGATLQTTSFSAENSRPGAEDITHEFTLKVTDSTGEFATDTITVTVTSPLAEPVANAGGNRTVASAASVTLDGSASKTDHRKTLTHSWMRTGGSGNPGIILTGIDTARLSFVADTLVPGAEDATHEFTLTVTDSADETASSTAVVTVASPFAAPVANAGKNQTAAPGATVTLDSNTSYADRRRTIASRTWTRTGGNGDPVTLSSTTATRPFFIAQDVAPGADDVTYVFSLVVRDSAGEISAPVSVTITIVSGFIPLSANAGPDLTAAPEDTVILDGRKSTGDPRSRLSHSWIRSGGTPGISVPLKNADKAKAEFTAAAIIPGKANVIHEFTLTVSDDKNSPVSSNTMTVTVIAPFVAPVADAGGNRTIASGETIILDGTGSTADRRRTLSHAWTRSGGSGSPAITINGTNTARLSLTAESLKPGAEDATHEFTLTITDSAGETASAITVVTVTSPFAAPVANTGGNRTIASGETITLDGTGSTADRRRTLSHVWTRSGGSGSPAITVTGADTARLSLTAENLKPGAEDATHEFTLTVTDSGGETASNTAVITVTSPFAAPVANSGGNRTIASGETITLDGTESTADRRRTLSHVWTRSGGSGSPAITINGTNTARLSLTAESLKPGTEEATHEFTLTVTDSTGETASAIAVVTVTSPFAAPVADTGGDRTIASGETITLDGTGSTADRRRTLSHVWTRSGGSGSPAITITGANTARLSLTAENLKPGAENATHEFTLTVTDSTGETASAIAVVTVTSPFAAPVADTGGDRTIASGETITLDGTGSTADRRRTLSHVWTRSGGSGSPAITITGANTARLSLTAENLKPGAENATHEFTLTVTDSGGQTASNTAVITVTSPFAAPVANAGENRTVASGEPVILDGSASTSDPRLDLKHSWERTGGSGPFIASLETDGKSRRGFMADRLEPGDPDVIHIFTLTVTDSTGKTHTSTIQITIISDFMLPIANAGVDRQVESGARVMLDGGDSIFDRRRSVDTWNWQRTGGTGVPVTLTGANTQQPFFFAETLADGIDDVTHVFTLTITDSGGDTTIDDVTITVAANALPVAEAGPNQTVKSGTRVTLEGSGSDRDGTVEAYMWERAGGNGNPAITLDDPNITRPSFTTEPLQPGAKDVTYIFSLTVRNNKGTRSIPDQVTITATSPFLPLRANAGSDRSAMPHVPIILDGSNSSFDPRTPIVSWNWTRIGGNGKGESLSAANTSQPIFTSLMAVPGDVNYIYRAFCKTLQG